MEFQNHTPFVGNAWESIDSANRLFATTLVRVRFKLQKTTQLGFWNWVLDPNQGALFGEDEFYHADRVSSVRYESDYVIYKPHSDLVVNANAYASSDSPLAEERQCGVMLYAPGQQPSCLNQLKLKIQHVSEHTIDPVTQGVPIRYEHCHGGIQSIKNQGKPNEIVSYDLYNPVGHGKYRLPHQETQHKTVFIDYLENPRKRIPAGFGFINRSWKSRFDYAGTYDKNWLDKQHPLPPKDFNFLHNQAAHPALITKKYIQPGSTIVLHNLIKNETYSYLKVPEYKFLTRLNFPINSNYVRMELDTLLIDIDSPNLEDFRIYASWRAYIPLYHDANSAEVMLVPAKNQVPAYAK